VSKRKSATRPSGVLSSKWLAPSLFALAGLMTSPATIAEADIASMLTQNLEKGESWRSFMVDAPAGSIHKEELVFAQPDKELSAKTRGLVLPDGKLVALSPSEKAQPSTPDEDRVTRSLKKGRIIAVEQIRPPKDFNAGSILDRQASLISPDMLEQHRTGFSKPEIGDKAIDIAMAFHLIKPKKENAGVPAMIASLVTNEEADSLATAYADPTPDYAEVSPFDSILTAKKRTRFVPTIKGDHHGWATNVLPASVFSAKEQQCLAEAIYFEAITEPIKGQAAVAQVVLNRVRNPTFPGSVCGVVYQNEDWRNRCQFSFACDRIPDVITDKGKFKTAKDIALAVTAGKIYLKEVGDSTHYHATYVSPNWGRTMHKVGRIGLHIFYRTRYGGWS
jgi:spore germination cell wall hydrolase CwlJ-like protein